MVSNKVDFGAECWGPPVRECPRFPYANIRRDSNWPYVLKIVRLTLPGWRASAISLRPFILTSTDHTRTCAVPGISHAFRGPEIQRKRTNLRESEVC